MTAEEIRALCDIAGAVYTQESVEYDNRMLYRISIEGWKQLQFDEDLAWNKAWAAYAKLGSFDTAKGKRYALSVQ